MKLFERCKTPEGTKFFPGSLQKSTCAWMERNLTTCAFAMGVVGVGVALFCIFCCVLTAVVFHSSIRPTLCNSVFRCGGIICGIIVRVGFGLVLLSFAYQLCRKRWKNAVITFLLAMLPCAWIARIMYYTRDGVFIQEDSNSRGTSGNDTQAE